jgi:hypothetical protein
MAAKQTAADRQRERMLAAATRRTEPDAPPAGRSAVRSRATRITVDLTPEAHRQLTAWTASAARELDLPRVTIADAMRAMAKVTALDPSIATVVLEMIRREKELGQ